MDVRFGFWEVVALAAAIQGGLLSVVIWSHRRGNRTANRLLGALLVLFSLQLVEIVLYWTRALQALPHLWGTSWFFPYLYGPLLLFYARALIKPSQPLRLRSVGHLLPFLGCLLLFAPFYLQSAQIKSRMLAGSYPSESAGNVHPLILAVWILQFVHFTAYLALSVRQLKPGEQYSARYIWLRRLFIAFGASFACWFMNGMAVALGVPYLKAIDYGTSLAMTATIYAIGYTALRQPELFLGSLQRIPAAKYERSTLTPGQAKSFERRLVEVMESRKPYLDADLRLNSLARQVRVHPHHLSQLINQHFKRNFNDFVNSGHFLEGTLVALRMAIDHPDQIRAAIILGGAAKFASPQYAPYTLEQRIRYLDTTMAPNWFKTVTLKTWNDNNFPASSYSRQPEVAQQLYEQVSHGPLQIFVRYLVEFWAADPTLEFDSITKPVLVLMPSFSEQYKKELQAPWLDHYFVDSWEATQSNPLMHTKVVQQAHIFVWLDRPQAVDEEIVGFLKGLGR